MNIMELANNTEKIHIDVSVADLKEFAMAMYDLCKSDESKRKQTDGTMSPKEAAKYLGKSVTTLIRWNKSGYLKPCSYVGNSPMYSVEMLKKIKEGK